MFSDTNGFLFFSPSSCEQALKISGIRPVLINGSSFSWSTRHHPTPLSWAPRRRGERGKSGPLRFPFLLLDRYGSVLVCVSFEVLCGFQHCSLGRVGRLCSTLFPDVLHGSICQGSLSCISEMGPEPNTSSLSSTFRCCN